MSNADVRPAASLQNLQDAHNVENVQDLVREQYGQIARSTGAIGCCGASGSGCGDPISPNLDKDTALTEKFRVLKSGGRFAVSDIVVRGELPDPIWRSMELWVGCVAGALDEDEYAAKLQAAGFADVAIEPWRIYRVDEARASAGR